MRRLAALALVGALLLGLAATATAQDAGATRLTLLDRTPWVGDGLDFVLTVQVANAPADALVRITVHDRVQSRSEFARSVVGEGLRPTRRYESGDTPLADIPQSNGAIRVAVPLVPQPGVAAATITRAGVYPVVLELRSAGGESLATLRTHLVRLPALDPDADAVPLDVAVVLPIDAPPAHLTVGPPTVPDAPIAEVADVLARHPDVPLTLVPTPETIAAAAATEPEAVDALARTLTGRQVLTGPWVSIDEAAWARADPAELLRQLDRGRRSLIDTLGVEPGPTRLLAAGTASVAQVRSVTSLLADGLVVDEGDLVPLETDFRFTLTRPFTLAVDATTPGVPALASDAALGALAAGATADPVLAAHLVLADLAVLASDQPALHRAATLVLPPEAARSPQFLDALLGGLEAPTAPPAPTPSLDPAVPTPEATPAAAPVVVGRTVAGVFAAVEPAGAAGEPDPDDPLVRTPADTSAPPAIAGVARNLDDARADVASYVATFGPDDVLGQQLTLLLESAASAAVDDADRATVVASSGAAISQQFAGLHPPARQAVRLTAREGRVQLVVTNDTGKPANVTLLLRGDRLVLPDAPDGRLPVQLLEQTTRIDLRVEARSSGDTLLDVVLVSGDDRVELGRATVRVRATAFSGVGVVLLGASAAFLVAWWTRTIVRERRSAKHRHPAHARGHRQT